MNRRDFLWLAFRLAGLYLMVQGVLAVPDAVVAWKLQEKLDAGVPLLAGLIFLAVRVPGGADGAISSLGGNMGRQDWFWLVCKTLGVWWTLRAVFQVPMLCMLVSSTGSKDTWSMVSIGVCFVAGLLLLFTNLVPDLVARIERRRQRTADAARPDSVDGAQHD